MLWHKCVPLKNIFHNTVHKFSASLSILPIHNYSEKVLMQTINYNKKIQVLFATVWCTALFWNNVIYLFIIYM